VARDSLAELEAEKLALESPIHVNMAGIRVGSREEAAAQTSNKSLELADQHPRLKSRPLSRTMIQKMRKIEELQN